MDTKFYKVVRPIAKGLFCFLYRPTIVGFENVPENGSFVLAGNHTKWLDPIMLVSINKRQIHFLAKIELFKFPLKHIIKGMGCIPVNRMIHDHDALVSAKECLKEGLCVGIFPEGTINRGNDTVMPFKKGAVKMSNATGSLIVPFVITGKYKLFRKGIRIEFLKSRKISDDLELENKKLMEDISKVIEESRHE